MNEGGSSSSTKVAPIYAKIAKELSVDIDIYRVVTSDLNLATLGELKTVRSVDDLNDYLEILDVHTAIMKERADEDERNRGK